ncbi:MAG TPA: glutamine synthetase type III, partial [Synergistaceae bacterium]|nr:glutamine synthetase type III [Synergistaceae bacterium]
FAPQFAEANLAVDQNQILMEQMRRVARQHGFRLLLHEKPFAFINGSGKHLNFSLQDSDGRNLLKPSSSQRKNLQFLTLLCSLLLGVSRYGGLLRASVATPGNMHRLGGNEAPPAIISVHLGDVLTGILERIGEGLPEELPSKGMLDLGLTRLPSIQPDYTDRNRTAPIAYTGNKFEFRAPGASQSTAGPLTMILAIWAWGMDQMADRIEARLAETDVADAALDAIKTAVNESCNIRFEGNCYSEEWKVEAIRRGLPLAETTAEALSLYLVPEHRELLEKLGIFTDREITAYYETRLEQYIKTLEIDITVMDSMVREGVLPALSKQIRLEGEAFAAVPENLKDETAEWEKHIRSLVTLKSDILVTVEKLSRIRNGNSHNTLTKQADELNAKSLPIMEELRELCQQAETVIAAEFWPFPRYQELLNIS